VAVRRAARIGGPPRRRGRLQIQRNLDFIDTQGDVRLDLDGRGAGIDAAIYWQARPDLGLGLVYRGRTTIEFAATRTSRHPMRSAPRRRTRPRVRR